MDHMDHVQQARAAGASVAPWDRQREEALLTGMLERYSPSGQERELAEWLRGQLDGSGLRLEVDGVGNFIAELPASGMDGEPASAPIVLLGHMDTVKGFIPVRREGDLLYGRGAVDAKGPLAAFLCALVRLAQSPRARGRAVIVVGAVEEESATSAGARAALERWSPACVVIGEPSGASGVTLSYKGRLLVHSRHEQTMAHTATPQESASARAVEFWRTLNAQAQGWNAGSHVTTLFDAIQPSLRGISSHSDGFTDVCEMEIGYRLPPALPPEDLATMVERAARASGAQVTIRGAERAYSAPRSGKLVGAFVRALRAEGLTPTFRRKTGTSDMNVVGPVWRCPILAYGPGDASLDHTPQERIELAEFFQGVAALERALADLTAEEDGSW